VRIKIINKIFFIRILHSVIHWQCDNLKKFKQIKVKNKKPYISKRFEVFKSFIILKLLLNTLNFDIIATVSITN